LKWSAICFFALAFIPLTLSLRHRTSKRYAGAALFIIIAALGFTEPYIRLKGGVWNIKLLHLHLAFAFPSLGLLLLSFALIWRRQRKAWRLEKETCPISPVLSYACLGAYAIAFALGIMLFYGH